MQWCACPSPASVATLLRLQPASRHWLTQPPGHYLRPHKHWLRPHKHWLRPPYHWLRPTAQTSWTLAQPSRTLTLASRLLAQAWPSVPTSQRDTTSLHYSREEIYYFMKFPLDTKGSLDQSWGGVLSPADFQNYFWTIPLLFVFWVSFTLVTT